jgi:bifunctional N-acetylglucosamine-1-phosphate-uridyltransferase/glucosamine-1-phosphate-acetyltransferase GlmU-like protein
MLTADLFIIAAGCGSRMNSTVPKALVPINDEPCLTTTLQQIGAKFRSVFIVTNVLAQDKWQSYFQHLSASYPQLAERIVNLPIHSGLGDGHATLQGILAAERACEDILTDDVVVTWGDVFFQHAEIIDELLSVAAFGPGVFPAVQENNPYVALLVNANKQCTAVSFSKYGEHQLNGYHDQSVFRFVRSKLKQSLSDLHAAFWKGGRYITPGGELSLLYSAHHLYNLGEPIYVYETRYPTLSFNTVDEVAEIQRELDARRSCQSHGERRARVMG